MLKKIISGGQTGVDRAALDAALEHNFPCGGWCPKGRKAEDGDLGDVYPLKETLSEAYEDRTEQNVLDSDATLILTRGEPTGGTALTLKLAQRWGKPCLIIDLDRRHNVGTVLEWVEEYDVWNLNVAGPRESLQPGIYKEAKAFLGDLVSRFVE